MSQVSTSTDADHLQPAGSVNGQPLVLLRLEGGGILAIAIAAYAMGHHSWLLFAILFLAPDISCLGYLAGARIGAVCYNFAHMYIVPIALGSGFCMAGWSVAVSLIWIAHIAFDRLMGYGLKYNAGFGFTHLGRLGTKKRK